MLKVICVPNKLSLFGKIITICNFPCHSFPFVSELNTIVPLHMNLVSAQVLVEARDSSTNVNPFTTGVLILIGSTHTLV